MEIFHTHTKYNAKYRQNYPYAKKMWISAIQVVTPRNRKQIFNKHIVIRNFNESKCRHTPKVFFNKGSKVLI